MKRRFSADGRDHGADAGPAPGAGPGGDTAVEAITVLLLRAGVGLAALLMTLGLVLLMLGGAGLGGPGDGLSVFGLVALRPQALIRTGLLVLIVTPVLRVLAAAIIYARERDRAFAAISVAVLALLLLGVMVARVGG